MKKTLPTLIFIFALAMAQAQTPASALNFDGVNDYVNITNQTQVFNYDANSTFTIEFWIKPSDKITSQTVIGKGRRTAGKGFIIRVINNRISFRSGNGAMNVIGNTAATAISPTDWSHVAITYNASAVTIFINGVSKATGSRAIQPIDTGITHKMFIGARRADDGSSSVRQRHFKGTLDDIRFWNTVKSESDILNNKDCQVSDSEVGLISYFKCNQGFNNQNNNTQTTLISSNTAYNATLNNFALTGVTSNFITSSNILNNCATLSIQENELVLNIKVFPNPSNGIVTILNGTLNELSQVILTDINGRNIKTFNQTLAVGENIFDFSDLNSGIYFIKILGNKQIITIKLIIK